MICCYPGQDVLRLQTLADERELTVEKVQKREDNSSEKACFAMWNHDENHDWWLFFWLEKSALIQIKEKFHRERKARIFRGWLCGFRTYFQYVYIYISISPPATFVTFGNLFQASEMQKRLQEMQGALLTETCHLWLQSFTSKNSAEHVGTSENASEERGKLQETEVELYRARESLSSVGVTAVTVVYQASYSRTITCPFCITYLRPEKKWMMWSIWKRWFLARVVL